MRIRLSGTRTECQQWQALLQATPGIEVTEASAWYPGRGTTVEGRVYLHTRPTPETAPAAGPVPACPAGGCLLTGPHQDVIGDALEHLAATAPARRDQVEAALRAMGQWHTHDPEDDCPPDCPAAPTGPVAGQENPQ